MASGKENNPPEHRPNPKTPSSEHSARLQEVRNARRKRILARSSERLAYITASAGEALLDRTNSTYAFSLDKVDGAALDANAAGADADICKYLSDQETLVYRKDSLNNSDHALRKPCSKAQPIKQDTFPSTISETSSTRMQNATMLPAAENISAEAESCKGVNLSTASFCKQCSLVQHVRFICVACTALLFLVAGFAHGGSLTEDVVFVIYSPLAVVFLTDLLLFTGAYFFLPKCTEASGATLFPIVMQLLLSVVLDCSISAALTCGGFLILSKYLPSYHGLSEQAGPMVVLTPVL